MEWEAIEKRLNTLLENGRHGELRGAMMMLNEVTPKNGTFNFMCDLFIIPKQFLHRNKNRKILINGVSPQKIAHSHKIHN